MSIHNEPSPLKGQKRTISLASKNPFVVNFAGMDIKVDDWFDRTPAGNGESIWQSHSLLANAYRKRAKDNNLPEDDEVIVGSLGMFMHALHISELMEPVDEESNISFKAEKANGMISDKEKESALQMIQECEIKELVKRIPTDRGDGFVEKMHQLLKTWAKKMLKMDGQLICMIHAFNKGKGGIILPLQFGDEMSKVVALEMVKKVFRDHAVEQYFVCTDTYVVSADKLEDRPYGSLADHPNRREALLILHVSYDQVSEWVLPYTRDEHGNVNKFLESDAYESRTGVSDEHAIVGRFSDLLPERNSYRNNYHM
jgi:hypothetical protein